VLRGQPPRSGDPADRSERGPAERFFVDGELASNDVEAIKKVVAAVSHLPVVTIRTKPEGSQEMAAQFGGEPVEVYTFQSSQSGTTRFSGGELLIAVRKEQVWRVVDVRRRWQAIACD